MRSAKALLLAGLMVAGLPTLAHAQWYVGADVGANYVPSASVSGLNNTNTDYNVGLVGLGQVGYSYGAPKVELEVGYRTNDVDKVNSVSGGGTESSLSFMVNGLYDFTPASKWHPFLGAGIGVAQVNNDKVGTNGTTTYSGNDWRFAYQGIAGIGYDYTQNWMVKAQYRYFATMDNTVTGTNAAATRGDIGYQNHSVLLGLTYKFNKPAAAPAPAPIPVAAPAPVPAAKPAPAPMKNFMVFFDFNKADITPEASKIITQAAAASKAPGITRVNLTGHTDLAGTDKYNMALSQKRGDAVKAALIRQGVPANEISVVAKGKSDPLVPTKDGVREPQNRRVEIVLQ